MRGTHWPINYDETDCHRTIGPPGSEMERISYHVGSISQGMYQEGVAIVIVSDYCHMTFHHIRALGLQSTWSNYPVTVDYSSYLFELDNLSTTSATRLITKLRIHFPLFGMPDVVVSDNGQQFACEEFMQFGTRWPFGHVRASPRYPQSNGNVENAVKTAKQLSRKAIDDKADVYLVFLDYRNTNRSNAHIACSTDVCKTNQNTVTDVACATSD